MILKNNYYLQINLIKINFHFLIYKLNKLLWLLNQLKQILNILQIKINKQLKYQVIKLIIIYNK